MQQNEYLVYITMGGPEFNEDFFDDAFAIIPANDVDEAVIKWAKKEGFDEEQFLEKTRDGWFYGTWVITTRLLAKEYCL